MDIKERIGLKADELFCRYGIRSITMDEIATQLGISKKTIYQYFSDKEELVGWVIGHTMEYARECCLRDREEADNAIDEIFRAIEFVETIFHNMNASMMFDLERYHPNVYAKFLEYKVKFLLDMIRINLERGIREELYRPELKVDIIARFRLESLMIMFNQDVFPSSRYNLATLHQEIMVHFLFGLASLKGYKLILKYQQERNKKAKHYETLPGKK